jgi:hypothetical protein
MYDAFYLKSDGGRGLVQRTEEDPIIALIQFDKDENGKSVMVSAKKYVQKVENGIGVITKNGQPEMLLVDADNEEMQRTSLNRNAMQQWCAAFKKNSKKPAMWGDTSGDKEEIIKEWYPCTSEENSGNDLFSTLESEVGKLNYPNMSSNAPSDLELYGRIKNLQENEWQKWQVKDKIIRGMHVGYREKENNEPQDNRYAGLKLTSCPTRSVNSYKYFIVYDQSPNYQQISEMIVDQSVEGRYGQLKFKSKLKGTPEGQLYSELENNSYHEALQSLQATKDGMESALHNQSYFQRLWNYGKRKKTQEALGRVSDEIVSFTDRKKYMFTDKNGAQKVFIPREVFTKSCMHKDLFEQVKKSRE